MPENKSIHLSLYLEGAIYDFLKVFTWTEASKAWASHTKHHYTAGVYFKSTLDLYWLQDYNEMFRFCFQSFAQILYVNVFVSHWLVLRK